MTAKEPMDRPAMPTGAEPDLAAEAIAAIAPRPPGRLTPEAKARSWRRIWSVAVALLILASAFAAYLSSGLEPEGCHEADAWAYIWLLFSPALAAVTVLVMGFTVAIAAPWAAQPRLGVVLVLTVGLVWVGGYFLDSALERGCVTSNVVWGVTTLVLPVALGIGAVLLAPLRSRPPQKRR